MGKQSSYPDFQACQPGIAALPEMLVADFRIWAVGERGGSHRENVAPPSPAICPCFENIL